MEKLQKRSPLYLISIILIYGLLVAPHEGEFWPFSIYPMFSKAGKPWTRALVRDVSSIPDSLKWNPTTLHRLYGQEVALNDFGVDQIDFANFVSKTTDWDQKRVQALKHMFSNKYQKGRELMVMKVTGWLEGRDSITTRVIPLFLITENTVYRRPRRN